MKKIIARWICCCLLPMLLTGCAAPSAVKIGEQTDSLPSSAYLPVPQLPTCEEVTLTAEKGVYPAGAQAEMCIRDRPEAGTAHPGHPGGGRGGQNPVGGDVYKRQVLPCAPESRPPCTTC